MCVIIHPCHLGPHRKPYTHCLILRQATCAIAQCHVAIYKHVKCEVKFCVTCMCLSTHVSLIKLKGRLKNRFKVDVCCLV